jgi:hypothetical protein
MPPGTHAVNLLEELIVVIHGKYMPPGTHAVNLLDHRAYVVLHAPPPRVAAVSLL